MDPKNINQLDPKLKEAYDRVMGMDLSSSQGTPPTPSDPAQVPPPPPPLQQTAPAPGLGQNPFPPLPENPIPQPQAPTPAPAAPDIPPPPPPLNPTEPETALPQIPQESNKPDEVFQSFNASSQPDPQPVSPTVSSPSTEAKPKSKIATPILIFVGLIFFVIYAVLWGKIFGVF